MICWGNARRKQHMLPYVAIFCQKKPSWMLYELISRRHKLIVWVETSELGQVFRLAGSVFVGEFRWSWQIKEGPQWPHHQHADGVRNCDNTFWQSQLWKLQPFSGKISCKWMQLFCHCQVADDYQCLLPGWWYVGRSPLGACYNFPLARHS